MKRITILISGIIFLTSCSKECTRYVEGEETEKEIILNQENIYPDCNDTANYLHKALYPDGTIAHIVEIKNNKKEGLYQSFDINGNPERIGEYKNGKRNGLWKIWTDSSYFEKNYINDILLGKTIEKLSNGNIVYGQYKNNKEQGLWEWFNKDSMILESAFYVEGKLNGEGKKFYSNGQIDYIGRYVDSKRTGICKWFYENGQLEQEILYNNDLKIEIIGSYDKSGNKRDAGTLKNGNGTWIKYDVNGNIETIENYKNGIKIE
jgi:antitoxin component YwqK of YwqJK toxin-antitoxin module